MKEKPNRVMILASVQAFLHCFVESVNDPVKFVFVTNYDSMSLTQGRN